MSLSDIRGSGGAPPEGEQEGESPAFRAGKGQAFLTCEPREGHRESIGAKGQWCALVKSTILCKANVAEMLRGRLMKLLKTIHFILDKTKLLGYI